MAWGPKAALRVSTGRTGLFVTMSVPFSEAQLEVGSSALFERLAAAEVGFGKAVGFVVGSR